MLFLSESAFNVALALPFVVSMGFPFSMRYSSSMTKTLDRALRRVSQPILELILVRRLYALAKVPCNPGAGSLSKLGSV